MRAFPEHARQYESLSLRLQAMKLALKHALAAIILVLSFAAPVAATPLDDAVAAYTKGD